MSVISSDPLLKNGNSRFTTVLLKAINHVKHIVVFQGLKALILKIPIFFPAVEMRKSLL